MTRSIRHGMIITTLMYFRARSVSSWRGVSIRSRSRSSRSRECSTCSNGIEDSSSSCHFILFCPSSRIQSYLHQSTSSWYAFLFYKRNVLGIEKSSAIFSWLMSLVSPRMIRNKTQLFFQRKKLEELFPCFRGVFGLLNCNVIE